MQELSLGTNQEKLLHVLNSAAKFIFITVKHNVISSFLCMFHYVFCSSLIVHVSVQITLFWGLFQAIH